MTKKQHKEKPKVATPKNVKNIRQISDQDQNANISINYLSQQIGVYLN